MRKLRVRKWVDGDSGRFTNGRPYRLAGVRAPESYQFGGSKALRSAAGMTSRSNGRVRVQKVGVDHYGRDLVRMWNQDGSINQRLARRGYSNKGR